MNSLLKITSGEAGEIDPEDQRWCVLVYQDTVRTACGHAYDACGDVEGVTKEVARGGITCKECLHEIKMYKGIKL